jgi:putative membrane-bound dehydrogenase-like protein
LVDENPGGWGHLNFDDFRFHATKPTFAQTTSSPLNANPILSQLVRNPAATSRGGAASETIKKMHLPAGFIAELIAAEPQVYQPIAFTFDARGRIWVVEGLSYPQKRPAGEGLDRILIFSDEDGDGQFESRNLFIEGLNLASGLEVGFGGVWVGAAPQLLFIPDRDQNDQPDSAPQVLLDGFGSQDTHETLNSFTWGPDGWLYGNQGVFNYSRIGKPDSSDDERVELRAGIWRYHPIRHQFEVFAHGGSNQWGLDFNEYGQLFMTHCRSRWGGGPTTHVIQGAHYWNQSNRNYADFVSGTAPAGYPFLRNYLLASARYGHGEGGAGKPGSRAVYGGHSMVGTMIYLGDNWPDSYRNHLFTHNLHGHQINHQVNRRDGSGYNTVHEGNDVFFCEDLRHIGVDLKYGPDGAVYTIDWHDQRLCHNPNVEQWDRTNGRIYRIAYAESFMPVRVNLAQLVDQALVKMLLHKNDWYVRTALRLLRERAVEEKISPAIRGELFSLAQNHPDTSRRLRGLWALHAVGGMDDRIAMQLLQDDSDYVRAWTIQLVTDDRQVSVPLQSRFVELAENDPSAVVRLYLASAMGRVGAETAWQIAEALCRRTEDAVDRNLPRMIWYGIAPLVPHDVERAFRLAGQSQIPVLPHFVRWYVAKGKGDGLNRIIQMIGNTEGRQRQDLLEETSLALTGQHQVAMPRDWSKIAHDLYQDDSSRNRRLAEILGATFGDESLYAGKRRVLADRREKLGERRHAFRILSQTSDPDALPLFLTLLDEGAFRSDALAALAGYAGPDVGVALVNRFASFSAKDRTVALNTLTSRESWAHALLDSVAAGQIKKEHLSAYYVRHLSTLNSKTINEKLARQWGKVERSSEEKLAQIAKLEKSYGEAPLWAYNAGEGKAHFQKLCSSCHRIDNEGTDIGPKLAGSGSKGIRYFAENIVDPNAVIGADFETSIVVTTDGRVVSGLVEQSTDSAVTLLTPTNPPKKIVIPRADIDSMKKTGQSLMPERMLESLNGRQIIELFKYLNMM